MTARDNEVRICTYNIHKGFCSMNLRFILDGLRDAIRASGADLVFLQEVVGERIGAQVAIADQGTSQFEYLADEVWHHHAYGKNAVYQKGHHGNAILSKWPLLDWSNYDISHWWFSQRGILFGRLDNGVYAICIHFGLLKSERTRQMVRLHQIIEEKVPADAPLMIAGDFNDWTLEVDRHLKKLGLREALSEVQGRPAKTFPARLPLLRMDRIYYRNAALQDARVLRGTPWQRLSDHCALYARFSL